jgi:phosphate-selective porin
VPLLLAASPLLAVRVGERSGGERLSIDGYAHVQWVQDFRPGAWPSYGFNLRRARVGLEYEFTDRAAAELEVGADRLDLELKDAFISYRVGRPLRLVAGLQKMPFSREELVPSNRLTMVERSALNGRFGDRGFLGRDIGLAADGELGIGGAVLGYALGAFNGNRARLFEDDDDAKQFCERVTVAPAGWLSAGVNATQRNDSLSGRLVHAYGGDAEVKLGPARVALEVLAGSADTGTAMLGAWFAGSVRLGALEPALRVERFTPDLADAGEAVTAITAGLNWHLHERVRLKANLESEFESGSGAGHSLVVEAQAGF